uniref:NADH-ubiquinone oxidoreductase chain 2 n=1 Tax=Teucriogethes sp. TaxID=3123426 RepID=A0AAN0LHD6_9CUCU
MKFYKMLFFSSMIFSTLMAISSFSWFSMWMGLEMNLLSIIPLFKSVNNIYPNEASIKYFITQTIASSIILLAIMLYLNMNNMVSMNMNMYLDMMLNSGFLIKMGAAPFHMWFPEVMEGLNWNMNLLMLTWQKIAPMILLMNNMKINMFISMVIISSSLISGIQGVNQISMRKILTYSSINHISWMISSMMFSSSIWVMYFMIYSLISINIILILKNLNVYYLKQLFNSMNNNNMIKILFSFNFLSLGGIPPFLGFIPKWLTINFMIMNNMYIISTILIIFTLMTLYFYIRISMNSMIMYSSEKLNKMNKLSKSTMTMNFISIMIM